MAGLAAIGLEYGHADLERRTGRVFPERDGRYDQVEAVKAALSPGGLGDGQVSDRRRVEGAGVDADGHPAAPFPCRQYR